MTPLIVCPTAYSGGGSRYHEVMGEHLDKDIGIMWTGSSIVSDIRTPALKGINKYLKRPAFIWWNFPVTDYVRHALFLGAHLWRGCGRDAVYAGVCFQSDG